MPLPQNDPIFNTLASGFTVFNVQHYGATGTYDPDKPNPPDDTAAFNKALEDIAKLSKVARPGVATPGTEAGAPPIPEFRDITDPRGVILFVPTGNYRLTSSLTINRSTIIQGAGGSGGSSRLFFEDDIDGIVIADSLNCPDETDVIPLELDNKNKPIPGRGTGGNSVIRDLHIVNTPFRGKSGVPFHPQPAFNENDPLTADPVLHNGHEVAHGSGVVLYQTALIENCLIERFKYDGIHIEAIDPNKNANGWQVHNCQIKENGRHGIFVGGGLTGTQSGLMAGTLCQGNSGWGVYDRSQAGNTYVACDTEANGYFATVILALALDTENPAGYQTAQPLYIVAASVDDPQKPLFLNDGVFRSIDSAQTWTPINRGLQDLERNAPITAIVADHSTNNPTLYAGAKKAKRIPFNLVQDKKTQEIGVFRSRDDGNLWEPVGSNSNINGLQEVLSLTIDRKNKILYAGTNGNGVFMGLIDPDPAKGIHWKLIAATNNLVVQALAIDPADPQTIFAGTTTGVWTGQSGSANWNQFVPTAHVLSLAVEPTPDPNPLNNPWLLNNTKVYAGTTDGDVWRSDDSGQTWPPTNKAHLPALDVHALAVDLLAPVLYAGTRTAGVFTSTNHGPWMPSSKGLALAPGIPVNNVLALATDPGVQGLVYAGTDGNNQLNEVPRLFKSLNAGADWTPVGVPYYGGGYMTTDVLASNVLVGCYAEPGGYGSELSTSTLVLGGSMGGGFDSATTASIVRPADGLVGLPVKSPVIRALKKVIVVNVADPVPPIHLIGDKEVVLRFDPKVIPPLYAIPEDIEVILIDAGTGSVLLQLPRLGSPGMAGRQYTLKRIDQSQWQVNFRSPDSPIDNIQQSTDVPIAGFSAVSLLSDGTAWHIVCRA
ncbi:MAG TPA: right-handed parallel beta-helix repeat-containing protein [Chthonomonadaceae bacterium]|nr:right-handed parallel beta-helix repeat-containing protein [Chthonomonadaceae bacterium]